ncbi:hypothetical protein B0A55_05692 [Friedmanniomyces simplex]|uniref:Uncharacterized protein n=1 Tax=Friedmanniomyces simplex TaxID=329884 RepID=A0A4U0XDG9_9PEZI|nr:hypothetical protein B0A55_05692 [Friedmanniomyces simplex]
MPSETASPSQWVGRRPSSAERRSRQSRMGWTWVVFITLAAAGNGAFTTAIDHHTFNIVEDPSGEEAVVNGISVSVGGPATITDGQTVSAVLGGGDIARTFLTGLAGHGQKATRVTGSGFLGGLMAASVTPLSVPSDFVDATTTKESGRSIPVTFSCVATLAGLLFAMLTI